MIKLNPINILSLLIPVTKIKMYGHMRIADIMLLITPLLLPIVKSGHLDGNLTRVNKLVICLVFIERF